MKRSIISLNISIIFIIFIQISSIHAGHTQADSWAITKIQEEIRKGNSRLSGILNDSDGNSITAAYEFMDASRSTPEDNKNQIVFDKRTFVQAVFLDSWGASGDVRMRIFSNSAVKMHYSYYYGTRSSPRGGDNRDPRTFNLGWFEPRDVLSAMYRRAITIGARGVIKDVSIFRPAP